MIGFVVLSTGYAVASTHDIDDEPVLVEGGAVEIGQVDDFHGLAQRLPDLTAFLLCLRVFCSGANGVR